MEEQLQIESLQTGRRYFTVSQLTAKVKGLLEMEVGEVWVKGEISGFKPSASGHQYFSLKDSGAVVSCARFRGASSKPGASPAKFQIQDGLEVIVHGRISVYAPRGNYQLIVDYIEPVGHGALQLAFEQLKTKLQKEGLFEVARKRPIPAHPSKIAIITSPTGAALQDMLNVLGRRNAGISILVVPSLVQGDEAAGQLVRAVQTVNQFDLAEVVVLARGGGSLEDLWCFNDEALVRAVVASRIPVISAVGHEVDFSLCDFAADLRAPTPSAAAELVSRNRVELVESIGASYKRLVYAFSNRVSRAKAQVLSLENRLVSPAERLMRLQKTLEQLRLKLVHSVEGQFPYFRQLLDDLNSRFLRLTERQLTTRRAVFESLSGRLEALSPLKVLGRGYTLMEDSQTKSLVKSVAQATPGREVEVIFHDGKTKARFS